MLNIRIPSDEEYLNAYHKEWNERCMKGLERMHSTHFSPEYLREQSRLFAERGLKEER